MDRFLGYDDVELVEIDETHDAVEAMVIANDKPACPKCGPHDRMESKGKASSRRLADTPSRGKPTALTVVKRRYKCLVCGTSVTQSGPPVGVGPSTQGRKRVTERLLRYIQNQVTKRPIQHVARDTGVPEGTVRDIAIELSEALDKHHCFPTPQILGMDGIKLNGTEYMVIGDADDGHLLGIVLPCDTGSVRRWMREHGFDVGAVDVFVTDMHSVNCSLAAHELRRAEHVADKWHIIHRFQKKVLSRAVDITVSDLRAGNEKLRIEANLELAQDIDDLKGAIMSVDHSRLKKRRRGKKGEQIPIDFGRDLEPYLCMDQLEMLSRAYWARYDLVMMYRCTDLLSAEEHFDDFVDRVAPLLEDPRIEPDVSGFLKHVSSNEKAVFNYFNWVVKRPNGKVRGPTTNALEQRNSTIRKIWRSGNGIRSLALLRLRAVYHQWDIGTEIVQCAAAGCPTFGGPFLGPRVPLRMVPNLPGWRCQEHAFDWLS